MAGPPPSQEQASTQQLYQHLPRMMAGSDLIRPGHDVAGLTQGVWHQLDSDAVTGASVSAGALARTSEYPTLKTSVPVRMRR